MAGTQLLGIADAAVYPYSGGVAGAAGTNEVQTITITGTPTGGTFTLTYAAQTTGAIPYNATALQVQSALEALSNIGAGDVACSGGPLPGTGIAVTFQETLGGTNVAAMTATPSLTGGTTPAVVVTETTAGVAGTKVDLVLVREVSQTTVTTEYENKGDDHVSASGADLDGLDLTVTLAAFTPVSVAAIAGGTVLTSGVAPASTRYTRNRNDTVPYVKLAGQARAKDADGGMGRVTYPMAIWRGGPDFGLAIDAFAEVSLSMRAQPDASGDFYIFETFSSYLALA